MCKDGDRANLYALYFFRYLLPFSAQVFATSDHVLDKFNESELITYRNDFFRSARAYAKRDIWAYPVN